MSMAERKTMTRAVKNPVKRKLTRAEKKEIAAVIQAAKGDGKPRTAQQTMLIVQDQVWNRVTVNRAEKKATRYYMDEFHLLLKEEQTAAYSVEIWKRFRKWGGIPTAITQNVKDLLSSREVENIFENSDFVLMLNQAQGDRAILAKQLNISPQQMKYVTHTEAGEGLIFYGNVVLPFIDRFPTDTELCHKIFLLSIFKKCVSSSSSARTL